MKVDPLAPPGVECAPVGPREPVSQAEAGALREFGWGLAAGGSASGPAGAVLDAYRAGVRDGRTPPEPRVFCPGDPEPGPEVAAVVDADGDVWLRDGDTWSYPGGQPRWWSGMLAMCGAVVACALLPDYDAAVAADGVRRAAAESAVPR